jgi:hypothetical protein
MVTVSARSSESLSRIIVPTINESSSSIGSGASAFYGKYDHVGYAMQLDHGGCTAGSVGHCSP